MVIKSLEYALVIVALISHNQIGVSLKAAITIDVKTFFRF